MTAPDTMSPAERAVPAAATSTPLLHRWLAFGTGFGIAIGARNLEAVIVRSRPSGPVVLASAVIPDFRTRAAAEWGTQLSALVRSAGENRMAATVLLPREETIVRTLQLTGVADKDIPAAIELQVDTLHPYGDEEIAWTWTRAGRDSVLVGLVRKALLESYETLFSEAGIGLAAVSFSSAVVHAALRVWSAAPASILCYATDSRGRTEVYGESEARPVFSAEFAIAPERALSVARAELRLAPDFPAVPLETLWTGNAPASPLAYVAALAGSAPLVAKFANILPRERRVSSARRQYLLPAVLTAALAGGAAAAFLIIPAIEQRKYLADLNSEIRRLEPPATRAQTLERRIGADRLRIGSLDDLRRRDQADLDVLNELTRLLTPPTWATSIEISPDSVVIQGETDHAPPLLKLLDSSPLFQNSEFALSVTRNGNGTAQTEQFRIKTMRRNRVGRTLP